MNIIDLIKEHLTENNIRWHTYPYPTCTYIDIIKKNELGTLRIRNLLLILHNNINNNNGLVENYKILTPLQQELHPEDPQFLQKITKLSKEL